VLKQFSLILSLFVAMHTNSLAQETGTPPGGVPEATISSIEKTGGILFTLDRAASVATDAMVKVRGFKRDRRLKGWITEETSEGVQVSFVGNKGKAPTSVLYHATVSSTGVVGSPTSLPDPVVLSDEQLGQFRARSVAMASIEAPCAKDYNSVVIPRASPDANWVVYTLPGTKKADVFPIGGSYRFEIDPTGTSVISSRGYAKTCIELAGQPNLAAFTLSHLLDPNPTEIHVFANLLSEIPVYVLTVDNRAMWIVEQGKIRFVKTMEETPNP